MQCRTESERYWLLPPPNTRQATDGFGSKADADDRYGSGRPWPTRFGTPTVNISASISKLLAEHFTLQRTRYQVQVDAETAGLFQRKLPQLR